MADMTLVIGNRALSSWSLRPWLAAKATGQPFRELLVPLDRPGTAARIRVHSPSGRVPALKVDGLTVWDSLAICEYLAERFPAAGLWPADADARAHARSVVAEMHAGFAELRRNMPMDLLRTHPGQGRTPESLRDIARVTEIWSDCRARHADSGPWLFGSFTIADCFYAPVATRLRTYQVPLEGGAEAYCNAILAHPAMVEWTEAARQEGAVG